jgi:hypothetical protein
MIGAPRTRLLRGYGPLAAAALLFVLMASFVPTVGKQIETRTVTGAAADAAAGGGAASGTDVGGAGDVPGAAGSTAAVASRARARPGIAPGRVTGCADRKAQVPGDPYSPPCVDFSGDNGGATYKGVSADTVTVSSRILSDTQSFLDTITQLTGGKITTSPEEAKRTFYGLVDYFNSRFQFYGRKLKVDLFDGKGTATAELQGGGQEEAEADAVKVAQELKAFADISSFTVPYADALSRRKVVNIGAPYMSREWLTARRPYSWSGFTDCSILTESTSDYGNKRLQRRPAAFAGGDLKGKMRKFATVTPENPWYQECVDAGLRIVKAAGNKIDDRIAYKLELNSMSNQAANIIAKLKSDNITTVVCGCDPLILIFLTAKATEQDYHPEWLEIGAALVDVDLVGQLYDQDQWSHAFGISYNGAYQPLRGSLGYHAYKSVRSDEPSLILADIIYYQLYILALGVQLAGPNLTPENFERGLFSYPGGTGPAGTWAFGPRHYTPTVDGREIYWDSKKISPQNNQPGSYVESMPGRRFKANEWPTGDPPVFP